MLVNGKIKIEIGYEEKLRIVVETLQEDWISLYSQNLRLMRAVDERYLEEYEILDMRNNLHLLDGIEEVLKYYMFIDEFEIWIKMAEDKCWKDPS